MNQFYTDAMVPGAAATNYGCTIPRRGRELIAKVLAAKIPLKITRVMMGQGICPENVFPGDLEDLIEPVAAGTSGEPTYDGDTVHMTVEYRSDLNGGLERGFWIREFGVFAQDVDGGEVMLYYGSLGDYPQWVSAYSTKGLDVRRYPVSITVGEGAEVIIDYSPDSFMTSDDVKEYCIVTMLPQFIERAQEKIAEHNSDPDAHAELLKQFVKAGEAGGPGSAVLLDKTGKIPVNVLPDDVLRQGGALTVAVTIPASAWQTDPEGPCAYCAEVSCENATDEHIPYVSLDGPSVETAKDCGFCDKAEAADGVLRFWADSAAKSNIMARTALFGPTNKADSGVGILRPATTETVGVVKVGQGLRVSDDGTLSLDAATNEEVIEILSRAMPSGDK